MKEWENNGLGVVGCFLGDLFESHQELEHAQIEVLPNGSFDLEFLPIDNKHTNSRTGMMIWEGARSLAAMISQCPEEFRGRNVVELGSGACPLPSMVASHLGARVIATDGSIDVVEQARRNLDRNLRLLGSRVECRELQWGERQQIDKVLHCVNHSIDWVLGADVLYSQEGVDAFFESAKYLLQTNIHGRLLLCYIIRGVSESFIQSCAAVHGFSEEPLPASLARAKEKECVNKAGLNMILLSLISTGVSASDSKP